MDRHHWFSLEHLQWARLWLFMGCLLIAIILFLSLGSVQLPIPDVDNVDKYMHFFAYSVLMGWFIQLYHHKFGRLLLALVFIAMGVGIECLQSLDPTRQFDVLDMLANTTGVTLALLAGFTSMDSILIVVEKFILQAFHKVK